MGGLTLLQANRKVADRARGLLRFADVSLAVSQPRVFDVTVSGEVERPGTLQGQANPWEVQVYVYSRDGRWWSQGKPLAIGGTRWSSVCHFGTNAPDGTHYRVVAVLGGPAGSAATKSLPQGDVVVASDTIEVVLKKA